MKEIIASAAAAGTLAIAWVCFVVITTYGGLWRILEGSFFVGVPAAFGAAVIAASAQLLLRRFSWPLLAACAFSGLAVGALFGTGSAATLRGDMTISAAAWLQHLTVFSGLGLVFGLLVFCTLWAMRRCTHAI